ncbi:MAG: gfo/Idh/MocA family oxidoreductase [Verrucomicrobia bacterium]|nr:gfo/Idh/MocA family oxidoreductase [Verrucomicrobiota bacterium]
MGTRRLRDLHARGGLTIALLDGRADRRQRAKDRFGLEVFAGLPEALAWKPDAFVISTPPGTKDAYVKAALDAGVHHFIEADIWVRGAAEIERVAAKKKLIAAPSGSFEFLPLVRAIGQRVRDDLGTLLSYQCYMATYMPGWHSTEGAEYYARHRNTTAAREMIPFELHWLNARFGAPTEVAGRYEKGGDLPFAFEDTWSLSMRLDRGGVGQLCVSMACPVDYRRGACFGTKGMITWDIYGGTLAVQRAGEKSETTESFGAMPDVIEPAYAVEINTFIDACLGRAKWPQSYSASQHSSATLAAGEKSFLTKRWERVDPAADPLDPLPSAS